MDSSDAIARTRAKRWRNDRGRGLEATAAAKIGGKPRGSRSDPESRYLRQRGGFCLGYTAEVAVSDDHLIVAQRVDQATHHNASRAPARGYACRKALVEPVLGVLKEQRGMRQFRRRGLIAVGTEWTLATTAHNLKLPGQLTLFRQTSFVLTQTLTVAVLLWSVICA